MKNFGSDYDLIFKSGLFDKNWYVKCYSDVCISKVDPLFHYCQIGFLLDRKPNKIFDPVSFRETAPYVLAPDVIPFAQHLKKLIIENAKRYESLNIDSFNDLLGYFSDRYKKFDAALTKSMLFDIKFYINKYPGVVDANIDPFTHYITIGHLLNLKPNDKFDDLWYLDQNKDAYDSNHIPLMHYHIFGAKDYLQPSPDFNSNFYIDTYPDIKKAGCDPLSHYLRYGRKEKRKPKQPSVLFVDGEHGNMSSFFRVKQIRTALESLNFFTREISDEETLSDNILKIFEIFVLFRCHVTPIVEKIISISKTTDAILVYDCDDLLFDDRVKPEDFAIFPYMTDLAKSKFKKQLLDSNRLIKQADYFTGPTRTLVKLAEKYVENKCSFLIPNYPPSWFMEKGKRFPQKNSESILKIFYFSGSYSHQGDIKLIEKSLFKILEQYNHVQLHIVGKLIITELARISSLVGNKVFMYQYITTDNYYEQLASYLQIADLVIAPLDIYNDIAHAKSELKYFDAACFGVPIIASKSKTFEDCIRTGKNGFLCSNEYEWELAIKKLIDCQELLESMGINAKNHVDTAYSQQSMFDTVAGVYTKIINSNLKYKHLISGLKEKSFMPSIRIDNSLPRRMASLPCLVDKKSLPSVDISIVTYFSSEWMDSFLNSLISQSFPSHNLNIFITDHSEELSEFTKLKNICNKYTDFFNYLCVYQMTNLGFGAGHNNNLLHAHSDWFLVINCDLVLTKASLQILIETAMDDYLDVVAWEGRQKPFEHPKYYDPVSMETSWNSGAFVLYRSSALRVVNGYDSAFFMYCEDVDLSFRLRDNGYKLRYVPSAVAWHFTYREGNNDFKPLQALGSLMGQCFLHYRFGTSRDVQSLPKLVLKSFRSFRKKEISDDLYKFHKIRYRENRDYFLSTKKKSKIKFLLDSNQTEIQRFGAFHYCSDLYMQPLVSVLIRVHGENNQIFLSEAVASVLNQTYSNYEIVIVEDKTSHYKSLCHDLQNSGYNIKYYTNTAGGRSASGNLALENAQGELVFFLDYDDLLFSDHIETLVSKLLVNTEAVAAVGHSIAIYTTYKTNHWGLNSYAEDAYEYFRFEDKFTFDNLKKHNLAPIQAIMFRRKTYIERGGFDLDLPGFEDWDLWLRYSCGSKFIAIRKTTSLFRLRNLSFHNYDKIKRQTKAKELIKAKYDLYESLYIGNHNQKED